MPSYRNTLTVKSPDDPEVTIFEVETPPESTIAQDIIVDVSDWKLDSERNPSRVTLKRLRTKETALSPAQKKKFHDMVRLLTTLNTDYIVRLYGLGTDQAQILYFASQWVPDGSLWDYIGKHKDCDRVKYLKSTAVALSYLHYFQPNPIIHGDINAKNIMVAGEKALLCNIASASPVLVSATGQSIAVHQGPEKEVSVSGDVYGFGLTIYEVSVAHRHPCRCRA
ncbi:hypothetical protein FRB99_003338 [Tulasnella sp. 403]|nr:hypothetical protein FRB99_003338 [Tulasnella sp. 403]